MFEDTKIGNQKLQLKEGYTLYNIIFLEKPSSGTLIVKRLKSRPI